MRQNKKSRRHSCVSIFEFEQKIRCSTDFIFDFQYVLQNPEIFSRRSPTEKLFWKVSQISQENTSGGDHFW